MNQAINDLLIKIKVLAEKGSGCEKETAQATLERLMKKYNISEDEIIEEKAELEWFRYKDRAEHRLLAQIIYMVTGDNEMWEKTDKRCKLTGCYCKKAEQIEIQINFDFYNRAMKNEIKIFFDAFMQKNHLFPQKPKNKVDSKEIDLERALKMESMMAGMDRHTRLKEIGQAIK